MFTTLSFNYIKIYNDGSMNARFNMHYSTNKRNNTYDRQTGIYLKSKYVIKKIRFIIHTLKLTITNIKNQNKLLSFEVFLPSDEILYN